MSSQPTIMVKFVDCRDLSERQRQIQKWVGNDLLDASPLFPDADDAELSTLFEIRLKDGSERELIIERLSQQDEVQYAHRPAEREPQ